MHSANKEREARVRVNTAEEHTFQEIVAGPHKYKRQNHEDLKHILATDKQRMKFEILDLENTTKHDEFKSSQ